MTAPWHASLRAALPVLERYAYLNSGTAGPLLRDAAALMADESVHELEHGRGNFADFDRVIAGREESRRLLGRLLGADPDEIALTHNTTDGINIVLGGFDWRPGDVIVTTTLEHDAVAVPLGLLARRHGVELRFADIGRGEHALDGIAAVLDERTRLLIVSHIVYPTGALLPLMELGRLAHAHGAQILVDGAQSAGAAPVDVKALGADYYTVSGQKWLCAPDGTGALYVDAARLDQLSVATSGYFSASHHDFRGNVSLRDGARRFETGMLHPPSMAAFALTLRWMLDDVGIERAWQRSLALAERCRRGCAALDGVEVVTPPDCASQLVAFDLPAFSPAELWAFCLWLAEQHRVVIRPIVHPPYALRASFGFFNSEAEVDRLVELVGERAAIGPGKLPIEGSAAGIDRQRR